MSTKPKTKTKNDVPVSATTDALPFEQAFTELETLVRQLEAGDQPLDEALKLFERGQVLAAQCGQALEAAELKVKKLVPQAAGHMLEDFEAPED